MAKETDYQADLGRLLASALQNGETTALESYLTGQSNLPGPRMNIPMVNAWAEVIGQAVRQPDLALERLESLLDGWAALSLTDAPVNQPREILPCAAISAYGRVAVVRPDWWDDEIGKLHRAASDPRWRVREMVAMALQRTLAADWSRTITVLQDWLKSDDPLVIRASAAAVAEPPLLKTSAKARDALAIQKQAIAWLGNLPPERRREENVRTLRQALGFTLSVAVAAEPSAGLPYLKELATSSDEDIKWIVKENLKKNRLKPWATQFGTP